MELSKKVSSKFSRRRGEWSTGAKHPGRDEGREGTELVGRPSTLMPRVGPCEAVSGMSHGHPHCSGGWQHRGRRRAESLRGHPQGTYMSDHSRRHLQEQVYMRTGSFQAKLRQQGERHPLSGGVWGMHSAHGGTSGQADWGGQKRGRAEVRLRICHITPMRAPLLLHC